MTVEYSTLSITPFRVDDATPVCGRLALLEHIVEDGTRTQQAWRVADAVAAANAATIGRNDPTSVASALLASVQQLHYEHISPGEWMRSVWYTLNFGGDCKDLSTTLAALCRLRGMCARIVWIDQPKLKLNHVSCQIWLDGAWTWADASVKGARLGETPYQALARGAGDVRVLGHADAVCDERGCRPFPQAFAA